MIKNSVKVLMTILLLVVVTIITLVGAGAAETQPKYGDTFIVGMSSDPATLNGAISGSVNDKTVASNIFSMLFRLDYKMNPVPDLAEEWMISDDGLVYTFKLRDGVKWHDGTPFTSADVKFSMDEAYMKLHPRTDNFNSFIESVETPDDKTVVFKLKKPYGAFMNALAYDVFVERDYVAVPDAESGCIEVECRLLLRCDPDTQVNGQVYKVVQLVEFVHVVQHRDDVPPSGIYQIRYVVYIGEFLESVAYYKEILVYHPLGFKGFDEIEVECG